MKKKNSQICLLEALLKKSVQGGFINSITSTINNININDKTVLPRMPERLPDRPQETESCVHAVRQFPEEKQQPEPSYSPLLSCYSGTAGSFECTFTYRHTYCWICKKMRMFKKTGLHLAFSRRFYPKRLTLHSSYSFTFYQLLLSLGIEPMILALLAPCSTIWATGKPLVYTLKRC